MTRDELVRLCFGDRDLAVGDRVYQELDGDEVLANVDVYARTVKVDGISFAVAAIAQVCTHPAYRGRGFATGLLARAHWDWQQRADFAALFGVQSLYERMGYQRTNVPELLVFSLGGRDWPAGEISYGEKW